MMPIEIGSPLTGRMAARVITHRHRYRLLFILVVEDEELSLLVPPGKTTAAGRLLLLPLRC